MALESSKAGMTLLKRGPLPFATGKSVAVIGQNVKSADAMTVRDPTTLTMLRHDGPNHLGF